MASYTDASQFEDILPMMADWDMAIIVTTATDWEPMFAEAGLAPMTLSETVVTSPRFGGLTPASRHRWRAEAPSARTSRPPSPRSSRP
jgi:hypothetical protein